HHFDVFARAAVVNRAGLHVNHFIDHFFVTVPLEVGLGGAKTRGGGVHFFQDSVEAGGVGRRLPWRRGEMQQPPDQRHWQQVRRQYGGETCHAESLFRSAVSNFRFELC